MLCAAHVINRMPLKSINQSLPYKRLFGQKPYLQHLKCYGCLCFASTLSNNRTKFDARARPCAFLGYPPHQKAYKVLDLLTNKIHISRDVVFHEQHFPFHHHTSTSELAFMPFHDIFLPNTTPHPSGIPNDEPDIFQNLGTSPDNNQPSPSPDLFMTLLKYLFFLPFHLSRLINLPKSINLLHISVTISAQPYLLPTSNAMQLNILAYLRNIKPC